MLSFLKLLKVFSLGVFFTLVSTSQSFCLELDDVEPVYNFLKSRYQPVNNPHLFDGTPEAIAALSRLPDELLPRLPDGYIWERTLHGTRSGLQLKKYILPQPEQASNIEIVIYGPNTDGQINYLTMIDGVNYQGFVHARPKGGSFKDWQTKTGIGRRYPLHVDDFDVLTATGWMRFDKGHVIPFHDTMAVGRDRPSGERIDKLTVLKEFRHLTTGRYYSTHDKRNYIPEPSVWNQRYRKTLEGRFQASFQCFLQYPYYDENTSQYDGTKYVPLPPRCTKNNTRVPEGVIIAEVFKPTQSRPIYTVGRVYDAYWESVLSQSPTVDEFCEEFQDPHEFLPFPAISHFERGMIPTYTYVSSLKARPDAIFNRRRGSYRALDKVLHLQSVLASHQFTRPAYCLEQAFDFSGEFAIDLDKTRYWVARSLDLASFMNEDLDGFHEILSSREYEDLEKSYRDEDLGFEDIHSKELDNWRQIYKDQEERRSSSTS